MEEHNIYIQDTIASSEKAFQNALNYRPSLESSPTFYVELPEVIPECSQPARQPFKRRRDSSIVNTCDLGNINNSTRNSLESVIRKKIRSSADSTSVLETKKGPSSDSILVEPVTRGREKDQFYKNQPETILNKSSKTVFGQNNKTGLTKMSSRKDKNQSILKKSRLPKSSHKYPIREDSFIVMPTFEPVSVVNQDSPFASEKRKSVREDKRRSKVKIVLSVEPIDEDDYDKENFKKTKQNQDVKKGVDRISSNKSNNNKNERRFDYDRKRNSKGWSKGEDSSRSRNPYGESTGQHVFFVENQTHPFQGKHVGEKETSRQSDTSREYSKDSTSWDVTSEEESYSTWSSSNLANKRTSTQDRSESTGLYYSGDAQETLGWERTNTQDYMVSPKKSDLVKPKKDSVEVRVASGSKPKLVTIDEETPDRPSRDVRKESAARRRKPTQFEPLVPVKAPKSVSKVLTSRRYHIQVPEEGQKETWFNVLYNFSDDSNVDWTYEGPVKITNYYSTSNYV